MRDVEAARHELAQAIGILRLAMGRLEAALEQGFQTPARSPVTSLAEHRRQHRRGVPSRLDTDEELRAFVVARLSAMTYAQLEDVIAENFPLDRRLSASSLRRWAMKRLFKPSDTWVQTM